MLYPFIRYFYMSFASDHPRRVSTFHAEYRSLEMKIGDGGTGAGWGNMESFPTEPGFPRSFQLVHPFPFRTYALPWFFPFIGQEDWDAGPTDGANVEVLLLRHGTSDSGPDMSFDTLASPEYMYGLDHASLARSVGHLSPSEVSWPVEPVPAKKKGQSKPGFIFSKHG
nr:hypothetical protein [Tanacetum cinerariifolium]